MRLGDVKTACGLGWVFWVSTVVEHKGWLGVERRKGEE